MITMSAASGFQTVRQPSRRQGAKETTKYSRYAMKIFRYMLSPLRNGRRIDSQVMFAETADDCQQQNMPAKTGVQSQYLRRICARISRDWCFPAEKMPREAEEAQRCGPRKACEPQRDRRRRALAPLLLRLPRCKTFHCHQRHGRRQDIGHCGAGHGKKRRDGHQKQSASGCVPPVPSEPKDQRSHRHDCNPDQHQLR